ncbi:RNA polymerase subunit sigma-70 [Gordonia shandongensis]|uniref:RNA polymerase subunit sigma-70 n=1 Tax=Gordonia shandongensis TaxID=376351 RepID=UPI00040B774F|nr:RNA polymerase subunit sigma-70 [Gordonia shandongensis]
MTDDRAFDEATGALRAELLAHCYHMLGSATDAEDVLQDVYLRAWRSFARFEGRSSVRTWMYTIATNTCLSALEGRSRRPLPTGLGAPASDPREPVIANADIAWLQPLPDGALGDPAAHVTARESIGLAMVAAMQDLPPRQRAVLIMRDVLAFSAAETADMLTMSVAAANSALARARATVGDRTPRQGRRVAELTERDRRVWDRFCHAFARHDIPGVVEVLAADAIWEMPPYPEWYTGAENIGVLSLTQCPAAAAGDLKMIATAANGQPAAAMYLRDGDVWRPFQFDVLTIVDGRIDHVGAFFEPELFRMAGLPEVI